MNKLTAASPEAQSADLVAGNIDQLKALFPDLITEGPNGTAVNVDVLKALVGDQTITDADEKYGLNWHGKRRARQLALTPSTGTLRPCPDESVDWETTQNLMIEGDNLEVLKLLQKSYAGRVKLIYIDPPYNTGKDFVYPDNFQDNIKNYLELTGQVEGGQKISSNTEASGRFHTDWLNMVYPRLKLAHSLLQRDGFIFASIDDAEVHHLRQVMSEIFGEDNFIANVVWQKKYTRANDAQFFSDNHDHILVFAKSREDSELAGQPRTEEQVAAYSNPDGHPKGPWKATPLHAKSGSNTSSYRFRNGVDWAPPLGTYRRFSNEAMSKMDEGDEIWFGADGTSTPSRKSFLSDVKGGVTPVTIWPHDEVGHNHEANNELKVLLGQGVFDNPKPTRLVRRMLELASSSETQAIVLDFFAGSGTTGHAVLAQNATDGGNRRYILVQLPEPLEPDDKGQKVAADFCDKLGKPRTIAELTKERLRRAAAKVKADNPLFAGDTGFRVFKLDHSNIRAWNPNPADLEASLLDHQDHLLEGRSEADVLYELLLKLGLDLCVPIEQRTLAGREVHSVGGGVLMACLAEQITREQVEPLAQGIIDWHKELAPAGDTTCVFRDSAFENDVAKTNLAAILEQHGIQNVRSL
ncbi:site-specific DNA-methyltransferase [Dokdonella fugitiva]|uniref:site-specific DNA-methyltransferase (adenine-specific) n=1 Tax=Dokdonella fugitiva TaxID=328517 RepID=A0A4R2HXW2_9GAMM|nr:site-specific DNA-methyltransferase [Dokdonella fugitiva]TCO36322.1 adenine-specific DNA-methyltransferase [Dokdonella fugitiva]